MKASRLFLILLLSICTIVLFDSCQKDQEVVPERTDPTTGQTTDLTSADDTTAMVDMSLYQPEERLVQTSVTGLIVDGNNLPVQGAVVSLADAEYVTDENGRFIALDVSLNSKGNTCSVSKNGYYKGVRRLYPRENSLHQTKIELIERNVIGSFDTALGASLKTEDDLLISFSPNSIVDEQGNFIEGDVEVSAFWIDPSDESVNDRLPGSLVGLNSGIEEVALQSFSMAAIELSVNGQEVNIAPGETAEIEFPIPTALIDSAPAEIQLWSLNEELGIWIEEGVAFKKGEMYVGKVSHFSFWNCDAPFPLIDISASIKNNGLALPNVKVTASMGNASNIGCAYSDSSGFFSGLMPADRTITLDFFISNCLVFTMEVGPFSEDTDLGTITLPFEGLPVVNISGTVVDCEGEPIPNAFVEITSVNFIDFQATSEDGNFYGTFPVCSDLTEIEVQAFNYSKLTQSEVHLMPFTGMVDFGELEICEQALEQNFLTITYQDSTKVFGENNFYFGIQQYGSPSEGPSQDALLYLGASDTSGDGCLKTYLNSKLGRTYNLNENSWNIESGTQSSDVTFSFWHEEVLCSYNLEPNYSYSCGYSCSQESDGQECQESCDNFEFILSEFNVNPIYNYDVLSFQLSPGDIIAGKILVTTLQGEFLEVEFRYTK